MIDLVGKKAHYQAYKENYYSSEKEEISDKKNTGHELETESSILDLYTILQRSNSPRKPVQRTLQIGKSSSCGSTVPSTQQPPILQKSRSVGQLAKELGDNRSQFKHGMSLSPGQRQSQSPSRHASRVINNPRSSLSSPENKKGKTGSFVGSAHSISSSTKKKFTIKIMDEEEEVKKSDLKNQQKFPNESDLANSGERFLVKQESMENASNGKDSPFQQLLAPKFETHLSSSSAAMRSKFKRPSKTVVFDQYGPGFDINPEDIGIDIENKIMSNPKTNNGAQHSLDNSMQKEDQNARLRFNGDYFQKQLYNRIGVPTITAKKRQQNEVMNLYNFDKNLLDPNPKQEQDSQNHGFERSKTMNFFLMQELASIENQKQIKMKMEQFVLRFNKDAQQGINYLISSDLVKDTPDNLAQSLLVTEGLNKEQIGAYLGSYKEKNKTILKAYCQLLDFRKLEFDQALRLLLSRFKLPGEAQQIERIVGVFASVYHSDNPKVFADEDTPFILAYSLLMLNTDAHSEMIQSKNKMTRNQFIENNARVCKLPKDYLGRMYDNIVKQKFETKADYIETIYNRLHQGNLNIQGEALKNLFDLAKDLMAGGKFIKYGRKGKSHERKVWISEKEDAILWISIPSQSDKPRFIHFSEIRDVRVGHNSTDVLIKNKVPSEFDPVVFSIVSTNRTLDLRAPDVSTRVKWERYFRLYLVQRKSKSRGVVTGGREQRKQKEKDKLSEIWKVHVLPNWEAHWDYENRRPKNSGIIFAQYQKKNGRESKASRKSTVKTGSSIWNFFRRKKKTARKYEKKSLRKLSSGEEIKIEEDLEEEEDELEILANSKDHSFLMVNLWRRGIPVWLRSILWPISISNQLEITENLYSVLMSQARVFLREPTMTNSIISDSLKVMQADLRESLEEFPVEEDKKEALVNILEAFVFYRPDVGYVKGMCRLVMVLLLYCTEYQTFQCFINLTHSHHFISFFRGIMREIEWRIRFFNKVFAEELPHLYDHFKALDLSSEMFLLEWFLSLFSMAISDIDIISRIWDCFLLEGEVYAIKTGVAILKYFELELKMLTFDGAIRFLKELPHEIDEDLLFSYIERVDVSRIDYQDELGAQKVAEINSKVHQALLEN